MADPRKPTPEIFGTLDAVEQGDDYAAIHSPLPPGTVVEVIPPTDIKIGQRGRIRRRNLERQHNKAVTRRDEERVEAQQQGRSGKAVPAVARSWPSQNLAYAPRQRRMFVKPADARRVVLDLLGRAYPAAGLFVSAGDTYVHRRLRDGSLVRAEPPGTGAR